MRDKKSTLTNRSDWDDLAQYNGQGTSGCYLHLTDNSLRHPIWRTLIKANRIQLFFIVTQKKTIWSILQIWQDTIRCTNSLDICDFHCRSLTPESLPIAVNVTYTVTDHCLWAFSRTSGVEVSSNATVDACYRNKSGIGTGEITGQMSMMTNSEKNGYIFSSTATIPLQPDSKHYKLSHLVWRERSNQKHRKWNWGRSQLKEYCWRGGKVRKFRWRILA